MVKYKLPYVWELYPKDKPEMTSVLIGTIHVLLKSSKVMRDFAYNLHLEPYFHNKEYLLTESEVETDIGWYRQLNASQKRTLHFTFLDGNTIVIDAILEDFAKKNNIPHKGIESFNERKKAAFAVTAKTAEEYAGLEESERTYRTFLPFVMFQKLLYTWELYKYGYVYMLGRFKFDYSEFTPDRIDKRDKKMAEKLRDEFYENRCVAGVGLYHCPWICNQLMSEFVIRRI